MADRLLLDYSNMLVPAVGARGIEPADLDGIADRVGAIVGGLEGRRAAGELGFLDLPGQRPLVDQIRAFGEGVGQAFDTILVLGIGGSALGTLALQHAQRLGGVETTTDYHAPTGVKEWCEEHKQAAGMEHGRKDGRNITGAQIPADDGVDSVPNNLPVGNDGAFGAPGCARGVQNAMGRFFMQVRRRHRLVSRLCG